MNRIGRGPGALRRWTSVAAGVFVLTSLPSVVARLPVADPGVTPAETVAAITASTNAPYQGYAEAFGRLRLPDVRYIGDLLRLLGTTTKLRVWWRGPDRWRVDELTAVGERALYRDNRGTLGWDSGENRVTRVQGEFDVRLPRAADLLPPELGRRFVAAARPDEVTALPPRRVAGVATAGIRIVPRDRRTTIGRVDVWADPRTGLPLAVSLYERGATTPVLHTHFLDFDRSAPPAERVTFRPPDDAEFDGRDAPDFAALLSREFPLGLPDTAGGLRRRGAVGGAGGTYGEGFGLVGVLAVPYQFARRIARDLRRANLYAGETTYIRAALMSGLFVWDGGDVGWVLSGAVEREVLDAVAADLRRWA